VGEAPEGDQLYRLTYDGSVADEDGFVAMGGNSEELAAYLRENYRASLSLEEAMSVAVRALGGQEARDFSPDALEVAVLDRARPRRKFKRLLGSRLAALMPAAPPDAPTPAPPPEPLAPPPETP
jgi:proteasome alpha subunit